MSQSNSIEAIKNQIKEMILLEKNAKMLFNDIVEPFVNNFFEQRFIQQGKLNDTFLHESYKINVVCYTGFAITNLSVLRAQTF